MYKSKLIYYISIFILILISFFLYSYRFYPLLSSDDALNILMTYYYKLPRDIYCWGQDRGGTLIPLISQIFYKGLNFSPVLAVSFSGYLILILGYIGFSSLLRSKFTKVLFALVWFFPPIRFIDLLRFPLGIEYSLIGFAIFLINKVDFDNKNLKTNHLLLLSIVLLFGLAIWVSDLAVITILILLFVLFYWNHKQKHYTNKLVWIYFIGGVIIISFFIWFAKSKATVTIPNYTAINNLKYFIEGIKVVAKESFKVFTFSNEEPFFSIYAWLIIGGIALSITYIKKNFSRFSDNSKKWLLFFLFDFIIILGVILSSKWVYLNGMGRWYFVPLYISLSMIILIIFDEIISLYPKVNYLKLYFLFLAVIGSTSTLHYLRFIRPGSLRPEIDVRAEFLKLGKIGLIGDFWNSYISACPNPEIIKATPYQGQERNNFLIKEVFSQPKIYLIKDMWLKSFPDTITQFGYMLTKKGNSFEIAGCTINEYEKIKRIETINFSKFQIKNGAIIKDSKVEIYTDSISLWNKFVIYGPFFRLNKGNYYVKYDLEIKNINKKSKIASFDVVANYGKTILAKKDLFAIEDNNKQIELKLNFCTKKDYDNVEIRVYYCGGADICIKRIKLVEK